MQCYTFAIISGYAFSHVYVWEKGFCLKAANSLSNTLVYFFAQI